MTQKDTNPYLYSDSNKRYLTFDWYGKRQFGGKTAKISLDAGVTCPNLDGSRGRGGCIYCKNGSSGAIGITKETAVPSPGEWGLERLEKTRAALRIQYEAGIAAANRKWKPVGYIPYLQANTNTYGPPSFWREVYETCASFPGAVMIAIATRADCLSEEILQILRQLNRRLPVMVELGLQTASDRTAAQINRCHTYAEFREGYAALRASGVMVGIHLINGLPGETAVDMRDTAAKVSALRPDMVKLHLLHVLTGTVLWEMYRTGVYHPMSMEEYVAVVCDQLELLPPETVIGRVTGDGRAEDLAAPLWSKRKTAVANEIDKELYRRGTWQGFAFGASSGTKT